MSRFVPWALVALCFVLGVASRSISDTFTVFVPALQGDFVASRSAITLVYSFALLVGGTGAPIAGWIVDRFGLRVLTMVGVTAVTLASAFASRATAVWHLYLCLGIVMGFGGASLSGVLSSTLLGRWFPANRLGVALAVAWSASGVGAIVMFPLAEHLIVTQGWRHAFAAAALVAAVAAAWVWRTVPDGVRPPPMDLSRWAATLADRHLMGLVAVTALSGAGQFTLMTYLAPYYRQELGASPGEASGLFFWFGLWGVTGAMVMTRAVQRIGASASVTLALMLMAASPLAWPLAGSVPAMALVLLPWGLGCFAANSAQQARLAEAAPASANALMALNTSAIYVGQGIGAAGGGAMVAAGGLTSLWPVALAWMGLAVLLSAQLARPAAGALRR